MISTNETIINTKKYEKKKKKYSRLFKKEKKKNTTFFFFFFNQRKSQNEKILERFFFSLLKGWAFRTKTDYDIKTFVFNFSKFILFKKKKESEVSTLSMKVFT